MLTLPLAVDIADAALDTNVLADVEATAEQLHNAHPEAEVEQSDVVAALKVAAGETTIADAEDDPSQVAGEQDNKVRHFAMANRISMDEARELMAAAGLIGKC